jgi:hypothetical protein
LGVRSLLAAALLAGLSVGTGCMPLLDEPEVVPLDKKQARDVIKCQEGIKVAGRKFVESKLKELESCVDEALEAVIAFENDLIDEDDFEKQLDKARDHCRDNYKDIGRASEKFVDKVIDACEKAEEWVASEWDVLNFQLLYEDGEDFDVDDVEELAGTLCAVKELWVDEMVFFQVPRMIEVLSYLNQETEEGEELFVLLSGSNGDSSGLPNIQLDERCESQIAPE